jgi:hypothetical protein
MKKRYLGIKFVDGRLLWLYGLISGVLFAVLGVPICAAGISVAYWIFRPLVAVLSLSFRPGMWLSEAFCSLDFLRYVQPVCGSQYISWYLWNIPFWALLGLLAGIGLQVLYFRMRR